jgi:RIO kinase 1
MELVCDEDGDVAPQLGHVTLTQQDAIEQYSMMVHYIKLMLCTGIIHGDLSEFNVLVDSKGPVIIDLPQAVNAAANNSAQAMFTRDVNNIRRYYAQFAPSLLNTHYAKEMWALFEEASLTPNTVLSGEFEDSNESADVDAVLDEIQAAEYEEFDRLERIKNADDE